MGPISVVMMTRNRREEAIAAVDRLLDLPERPPVIVVDNGSDDGTVDALSVRGVQVIAAGRNLGAAARNLGVAAAATRHVAFCDDDTWWEPGALARAAAVLDSYPSLGLVAARTLIDPDGKEDPISAQLETGLPARDGLPGTPILGFLACAAVVRRAAFLGVGGFEERLLIMGEEELLALDLSAAGWDLVYLRDLVMHHAPSNNRDSARRRYLTVRNGLWVAWLRYPLGLAGRRTLETLRGDWRDAAARRALVDAVRGGGWVMRERRPVEAALAAAVAAKDAAGRRCGAPVRHLPAVDRSIA